MLIFVVLLKPYMHLSQIASQLKILRPVNIMKKQELTQLFFSWKVNIVVEKKLKLHHY